MALLQSNSPDTCNFQIKFGQSRRRHRVRTFNGQSMRSPRSRWPSQLPMPATLERGGGWSQVLQQPVVEMAGSANVVTGSNFRARKPNKSRDRRSRNFVPVTIFASPRNFCHSLLAWISIFEFMPSEIPQGHSVLSGLLRNLQAAKPAHTNPPGLSLVTVYWNESHDYSREVREWRFFGLFKRFE